MIPDSRHSLTVPNAFSPIQLAPGGTGQNDVDGGEMRIDAGFEGNKADGLRFPLNTIELSTFQFTGCNDLVATNTITQSRGCQSIGSNIQSIQATLKGNTCTAQIFSAADCSFSSKVATVDLNKDQQCISEDDISNTFTEGGFVTVCCDESCGNY